jgi:hypothetical protein
VKRPAAPGRVNEAELLRQVLDLAALTAWLRAHFRPGRTLRGWATPCEGDARGFPDLVLLRPPRLVVAELKAERRRPTPDQQVWLDLFRAVPGVEVYVWRPADWPEIVRVLT